MSPFDTSLADFTGADPTWQQALHIVQERLRLMSSNWLLIRSSWNGSLDPKEFIRMLGFSRIPLGCLIDAAGLRDEPEIDAALLEHAIQTLGVRYSSVVLGINLTCQMILASQPPPLWRKLFQEMMTWVEIGYKMGARVGNLGVEGGALIGFAKSAGLGLLLAHNAQSFRKWASTEKSKLKVKAIELFGCEPFQISAFALQQLGYGHEIAIGGAIGSGHLNPKHLRLDERILTWKGALLWIEALREGRSYPADPVIRDLFPEIAPPRDPKGRNPTLEVLWTEVARVKKEGSTWTWHLPKPGYDLTAQMLGM